MTLHIPADFISLRGLIRVIYLHISIWGLIPQNLALHNLQLFRKNIALQSFGVWLL